MNTRTQTLSNDLNLNLLEQGSGRPVLLLHGGGGPRSIAGFADAMAQGARVIAPVHPGFDGTPRPERLGSVEALAATYLDLLEQMDLKDVLVIGFSMGGWIASCMAARDATRLRGVVLVNAVGIVVDGEPVTDTFGMSPQEISKLSYHDPEKFRIVPTPEQQAAFAANIRTLATYGGSMKDPGLAARLAQVQTPALVAWGESDGIATLAYGQAYAKAFGNGRFATIAEAGHMPQLEQPQRLLAAIREFGASLDKN
jgi:pimeloyl-ACP methyl ester carboxylesterase